MVGCVRWSSSEALEKLLFLKTEANTLS